MFPKSHRLLKGEQFDAVFANRQRRSDSVLTIHTVPNSLAHPRLGLAVSRKVGNAVCRNRWKRLIREAFRLAQHDLPAVDIVCLPNPRGKPTLEDISKSLQELVSNLANTKSSAAPRRRSKKRSPERKSKSPRRAE